MSPELFAVTATFQQAFVDSLGFEPDAFQYEGFDAIDAERSVLVSAPTGAGKTLIAGYGIARALGAGRKAFYTTPLKALSNQKFAELARSHGPEQVGILTGDVALRAEAPIVVMTTEVLRNMILAGSGLLDDVGLVVLDEVHYLQDPYRGGVWEEVLVLAPKRIQFVCLSATIGNTREFGGWLNSIRGETDTVVEAHRPISLRHHLAIYRRHGTANSPAGVDLLPLLSDGRVGGEAARLDDWVRRVGEQVLRSHHGHHRTRMAIRSPRRSELIEGLDAAEMLPGIFFIFSRTGCEDAVRQCVRDGIRLVDPATRSKIREVAERATARLSDDALDVLGYTAWLEGLEAGLAAHHAGMVPAFRDAVEECFTAGYLRVVFATETLSLGINMPARTVVLERFEKYGGAGRSSLTSTEYAQLTGRAGRRGLDDEGHSVVAWGFDTPVKEMAGVALAPVGDLRSSFRPTYNLVVNLVERFDRPQVEAVLANSFAAWQHTGLLTQSQPGNSRRAALVDLFDRRFDVLSRHGFLAGWRLTEKGLLLARIYHESDVVLAEAVDADLFSGLEPALLAGVLAAFVFEPRRASRGFASAVGVRGDRLGSRRGEGRSPASPQGASVPGDRLGKTRRTLLEERIVRLGGIAAELRMSEEVARLPRVRAVDGGLSGAVASWARGASLGTVLAVAAHDTGEIAPGDFVRTVKQLVDLAGQVADVSADSSVAAAARESIELLRRDVVGLTGVPEVDGLA